MVLVQSLVPLPYDSVHFYRENDYYVYGERTLYYRISLFKLFQTIPDLNPMSVSTLVSGP